MALELRTGCSSWTSPAWNGRFYPADLPDRDRLAFYARYFDAVEVDSSYYAAPQRRVVERWAAATPGTFRFTLKFPRDLLDPKRPIEPSRLAAFVDTARSLGPKLGALLLQFPPWFRAPGSAGERHGRFLDELLRALPEGPRYAVELREAGWYDAANRPWLERRLEEAGAAAVWSSLTYLEMPAVKCAPWGYLRFIGDHTTVPADTHGSIRVDRRTETERWAAALRAADLESAFAFFNNHFAGYAPVSVNLFREAMGLAAIALPESAAPAPSAVQRRIDG